MFKRLLLSVVFCLSTIGAAFAADIEINKADLAGLDGVLVLHGRHADAHP